MVFIVLRIIYKSRRYDAKGEKVNNCKDSVSKIQHEVKFSRVLQIWTLIESGIFIPL